MVVGPAAPKPGSETLREDAFDGAPGNSCEVRHGKTCLSEPLEGLETPLGSFDDCSGYDGKGQVVGKMDPRELDDPLHSSSTMDVYWRTMFGV